MKNITVTVDDELYRRARVRAAEDGRSVSAVVREFLRAFVGGETGFERLKREERELRAQLLGRGAGVRASERLPRDELHKRGAAGSALDEAAE